MATGDKREEAERLYVRESASCRSIAKRLEVDPGTVYRWKAEAAGKGESEDWDARRRVFHMSPNAMWAIYSECFKAWVMRLRDNPDLLADPKVADAMAKHASIILKLDPRGQYLGVALDLVEIINGWLSENEPELKGRMEGCWDLILEALREYFEDKKGLLK